MFRVYLTYCLKLSVPCSIVVTCWEKADLLALLYVMFSCVLSLSHIVSSVKVVFDFDVSIPDICLLPYLGNLKCLTDS